MTALHQTALAVGHGALLDLETAKTALNQLESLLFSMTTGSAHPSHVSNLIEIAWNLVADAANTASYNYETISRELDELAPQNAKTENVARNYEGNPTFAERIKLAREDAGLTQVDLAKACGISQANISELERGEVGRTSYLPEIARDCGISTDWLAFGNETLEVQP